MGSDGLPSEVVEVLEDREFDICDSLSTNELGGYFVAWRDGNGKALNGIHPPQHIRTNLLCTVSNIFGSQI